MVTHDGNDSWPRQTFQTAQEGTSAIFVLKWWWTSSCCSPNQPLDTLQDWQRPKDESGGASGVCLVKLKTFGHGEWWSIMGSDGQWLLSCLWCLCTFMRFPGADFSCKGSANAPDDLAIVHHPRRHSTSQLSFEHLRFVGMKSMLHWMVC